MRSHRPLPFRRDPRVEAAEVTTWDDPDIQRLAQRTVELMVTGLPRPEASALAYREIKRSRKAGAA